MSQKKKSAKTWQEKQDKQAQKTAENKRKREAAFIPPEVVFWGSFIRSPPCFLHLRLALNLTFISMNSCLFLFDKSQEPRKQDTKSEDDKKDVAAMAMSLKVYKHHDFWVFLLSRTFPFYCNWLNWLVVQKKAKDFGKQKLSENINAEAYIATAGEPSKKKSKRRET